MKRFLTAVLSLALCAGAVAQTRTAWLTYNGTTAPVFAGVGQTFFDLSGNFYVVNSSGTILEVVAAGGVKFGSLTGVGVLSSGILGADPTLPATLGGTGEANNAANTISFSGNYGLTLTLTNTTSVTLPTSGTLVNTGVTSLSSLATVGTLTSGAIGSGFTSIDYTPIGATSAAAGHFTTLAASSTISGTGFSTYLASPPAIGGTAPAAGSFTNVLISNGDSVYGDTTTAHTWDLAYYYTTGSVYENFLVATNGSTPSVTFGPTTHGTAALGSGVTATTQTTGDNSTKVATDAFVIANGGVGTVTHNGSLASGYLVIGGTNGTTDIKTDSAIQDDGAGTLTGLVSLTTAAFNVTGTTTFTGLSTNGPVTVSSGVLGSAAYLTNALGGTGGSSASSTGVAQVSSGTWSYSTALANGTTVTTQAALSGDTKAASDAYADRAGQAAFVGSWASPDTTAAVDTLTLTAPVTIIYTDPTAALRTYQLPAAAAGNKGMAVELIVAATQATYHVNFKPAASDVFYLAGAALTANHYVQDASTTKGDFIIGESDGVNWSFAFGTGYSGTSSWADAASP